MDQEIPRGIKEIMPYEYPWAEIWILLAIAVCLLAIGLAVYLYKRSKRKKPPQVPSPMTVDEIILNMEKLTTDSDFSRAEQVKYYLSLSYLARLYLETRYKVPATDLTLHEIKNLFSTTKIKELRDKPVLLEVLSRSEQVVFAEESLTKEQAIADKAILREVFISLKERDRGEIIR